jgi:hypothetical protein
MRDAEGTADEEGLEEVRYGLGRNAWRESGGRGHPKAGESCCCRAFALGINCTRAPKGHDNSRGTLDGGATPSKASHAVGMAVARDPGLAQLAQAVATERVPDTMEAHERQFTGQEAQGEEP